MSLIKLRQTHNLLTKGLLTNIFTAGETHLINKGNLISIMTKIFALTTIIDNILFHHYDSEKINQTINEDLLVYALNRYFVNKI
ncbi:hypothetical protein FJR08_22530 [Dolichospermum sp. UHCC 0260]|nr:hypothetical protein [Dolichospermum sp. UHCC 0260]